MAVLCPGCGTVGRETDLTCATCGGDLADDPVALVAPDALEPARPAPRAAPRRANKRRTVAVAVACATVAGLVATAVTVTRHHRDAGRASWSDVATRVPPLPNGRPLRAVALGPRSRVRLADFATGAVRELHRGGKPVTATTALARGDAIVVRTFAGRAVAFRGVDRAHPSVVDLGPADTVVSAEQPDRVWTASGRQLAELTTGGKVVAQTRLPASYTLAGGGLVGDTLLLESTDGTAAVWDPATSDIVMATRSTPVIAAAADLAVSWSCPAPGTTCRPDVSDFRERVMRSLRAPVWDAFEPPVVVGRVSPDGRYVAFGAAYPGHHDVQAAITLVDARTGDIVWQHTVRQSSSEPVAWDDRSDLLFFSDGVDEFVHHVDGDGDAVRISRADQLAPVALLARDA